MRIIAVLVLLFGFTSSALACGCINPPFSEAVDQADEIFIGHAIKLEEKRNFLPTKINDNSPYNWLATFEITNKWKGSRRSRILIEQESSSCQLDIEFSREYLVFASYTGRRDWSGRKIYTTWLCSRSINTLFLTEWAKADWAWDDRDDLNEVFPDQVKLSTFYSIAPIWILLPVIGISVLLLLLHRRRSLHQKQKV